LAGFHPSTEAQASHDHETPVEQAFGYGTTILNTRWVLVSDMQVLRLYSVESDAGYEVFDLREAMLGGPTGDAFRRLYFLLGHSALIEGGATSPVSSLFTKSAAAWLQAREKFYGVYYEIRSDLFDAVSQAAAALSPAPSKDEVLQAVQRLLDRMLFIYYCEDHPEHLVPDHTVKKVTDAARVLPGPSTHKAYDHIKALFKEIDAGSPSGSGLALPGYNGELFKDQRVIDHIDLSDALNEKPYYVRDDSGKVARTIRGVWGLHEYDFWTELNEHLLGRIFETIDATCCVSRVDVTSQLRAGAVHEVRLCERARRPRLERGVELLRDQSDVRDRVAIRATAEERVRQREQSADGRTVQGRDRHVAQRETAKGNSRRATRQAGEIDVQGERKHLASECAR